MSDTIYVYAEGHDFAAIEDAVSTRLRAFVEKQRWKFFETWVVNQRHGEDWDLGLNLAFKAAEKGTLPKGWFTDVEATLGCVASLAQEFGVSFVIGFGLEGKAAEDIFNADTDPAEIKRAISDMVTRPVLPSGWLRRTVRFDLEDGRPVAALGDYRVAFGAVFALVFSFANGERSLDDIVRAVASSGARGVSSDPTTDVLDAVRSLSRDGFVTLAEVRTPLPRYLSVSVAEQDVHQAQEEMARDGFDPNLDPRKR